MINLQQYQITYPVLALFNRKDRETGVKNYFYQIRNGKKVRVKKSYKNLKPMAVPTNLHGVNVYKNTYVNSGKEVENLDPATAGKIKKSLDAHIFNELQKDRAREEIKNWRKK